MMRRRKGSASVAAAILAAAAFTAVAAPPGRPAAHPAKGQSADQQYMDEGQCYSWTRSSTGIDPQTAQTESTAPDKPTGPAFGGGERVAGAAAGAAMGGIARGEDGVGPGAVVGIVAGGIHARGKRREDQESVREQHRDDLETFDRTYTACMEARGYSVE
jgi:hypothetical protein